RYWLTGGWSRSNPWNRSSARALKSQASSRKIDLSKTFTFTTSMDKMPSTKIQSNLKRRCVALLLGALWLAGCGKPKFDPVEIAEEDMCAFCKMAISEKQYAAEFLNRDGDVFKFDDIGCMVSYVVEKKVGDSVAAFYVVDF